MNLDSFLKSYGRKRVTVSGDGNCQFYSFYKSLSPGVVMDRSFHKKCVKERWKIGFYMWKNRKRFSEFFIEQQGCRSFREFCQKISSNDLSVIGNNLTLKAMAERNKVDVIVFEYNGKILRIASEDDNIERIMVKNFRSSKKLDTKRKTIEICYNGGHYDSVVKLTDFY